jgi:hypothetical protein
MKNILSPIKTLGTCLVSREVPPKVVEVQGDAIEKFWEKLSEEENQQRRNITVYFTHG